MAQYKNEHQVTITESERQMFLLAYAELSVRRPGWTWTIRETVKKFGDANALKMFEGFRENTTNQLQTIEELTEFVAAPSGAQSANLTQYKPNIVEQFTHIMNDLAAKIAPDDESESCINAKRFAVIKACDIIKHEVTQVQRELKNSLKCSHDIECSALHCQGMITNYGE